MIDRYTHPAWRVGVSAFLLASAMVAMAPILWIVGLALRTGADVYSRAVIPGTFRPENFSDAWGQFGLARLFLNSIVVTGLSVAVVVTLSVLAAYGFARLRFRGSEVLFLLILLGLMIPPAAVIIPLFVEIRTMGLYDTHVGLSLVYVAFGLPLSILILRSFFAGIPRELLEAARIDGASERWILLGVVVPLAKAPIATVAILTFLFCWNDYFLALVLLRDAGTYTLPVGIAQFIGQYSTPHELVAAAVLMAAVPVFILYLVLHRQFERGVAEGAVKQ
ncbi:MAG: carbohydrate ABC transporter permease [Chloroflexi bacterium]|nr:carbohydrate ABC transporter permease [Chloroflexota bacterium]